MRELFFQNGTTMLAIRNVSGMWYLKSKGGGPVPDPLSGLYTDFPGLKRAVEGYVVRSKKKALTDVKHVDEPSVFA